MSPPLETAVPKLVMKEIWQIGGTTVCWMLFHLIQYTLLAILMRLSMLFFAPTSKLSTVSELNVAGAWVMPKA